MSKFIEPGILFFMLCSLEFMRSSSSPNIFAAASFDDAFDVAAIQLPISAFISSFLSLHHFPFSSISFLVSILHFFHLL